MERLAAVPDEVLVAAAASASLSPGAGGDAASLPGDPWRGVAPWRVGRLAEPVRWLAADRPRTTRTTADADRRAAVVELDGAATRAARAGGDAADGWTLAIGDDTALVRPAVGARRVETVTWLGRRHRIAQAPPPDASSDAARPPPPTPSPRRCPGAMRST